MKGIKGIMAKTEQNEAKRGILGAFVRYLGIKGKVFAHRELYKSITSTLKGTKGVSEVCPQ